jgi:uncharacterized cupin superfamily protein
VKIGTDDFMKLTKPIRATNIIENSNKSAYPEPFATMMSGRVKKKLGDYFELTNFGINLTELSPGAISALKHKHLKQDEFIYILSGTPTLIYGDEEYLMSSGECFGFKCGNEIAHQLINKSKNSVVYLEIGDRTTGDKVEYPDNDLYANSKEDGSWVFSHKDGTSY